jgi:glycosyltransferase involved in cell wall biosynthesis
MLTRNPSTFARPFPQGLTRTTSARLLVDLSHAADGYVGVAQDLRLIFAMLCGIESLEVSGLLMPTGRHDLPHVRPGRADQAALTAAVLHWMERNWARPERRSFPFSLLQRAQTLRQMLRRNHQLLALADRGQLNALWRILFAKTLAPDQRARVLAQSYFATDLSVSSIIDLCAHPPMPLRKGLAAGQFDGVLFCMPRPVRLPPGVRQIVRFHDAVRACAPDAIFVCNSPQSLETLASLDPGRAAHAVVIPCAVAPASRAAEGIDVGPVIRRHLSFRALGAGVETAPRGWAPPSPGMRYVLAVSTLEPRKNFPGLIRAWERVIARGDPDLRLVIVGAPGWREESLLSEMRPGVSSGRLLHAHPAWCPTCLFSAGSLATPPSMSIPTTRIPSRGASNVSRFRQAQPTSWPNCAPAASACCPASALPPSPWHGKRFSKH